MERFFWNQFMDILNVINFQAIKALYTIIKKTKVGLSIVEAAEAERVESGNIFSLQIPKFNFK